MDGNLKAARQSGAPLFYALAIAAGRLAFQFGFGD